MNYEIYLKCSYEIMFSILTTYILKYVVAFVSKHFLCLEINYQIIPEMDPIDPYPPPGAKNARTGRSKRRSSILKMPSNNRAVLQVSRS